MVGMNSRQAVSAVLAAVMAVVFAMASATAVMACSADPTPVVQTRDDGGCDHDAMLSCVRSCAELCHANAPAPAPAIKLTLTPGPVLVASAPAQVGIETNPDPPPPRVVVQT